MPTRRELEQALAASEDRISAILDAARLRAKTPEEQRAFDAAGAECDRIEAELKAMGAEPPVRRGSQQRPGSASAVLSAYCSAREAAVTAGGPAGMRTGFNRNVYARGHRGGATAADLDAMRREIGAAAGDDATSATMSASEADRESMRRELRAAGITPRAA